MCTLTSARSPKKNVLGFSASEFSVSRIRCVILSRFKHVSHPRVGIVCIFNKEREEERKTKKKEIRMNVESKKRTEPTSRRVRYVCVCLKDYVLPS